MVIGGFVSLLLFIGFFFFLSGIIHSFDLRKFAKMNAFFSITFFFSFLCWQGWQYYQVNHSYTLISNPVYLWLWVIDKKLWVSQVSSGRKISTTHNCTINKLSVSLKLFISHFYIFEVYSFWLLEKENIIFACGSQITKCNASMQPLLWGGFLGGNLNLICVSAIVQFYILNIKWCFSSIPVWG